MNLRVNLILTSERRSASPISAKFALRVAAIAIPALLAAYLLQLVVTTQHLAGRLANLEMQLQNASPLAEEANLMVTAIAQNNAILAELGGWTSARVDWHRQLTGVMRYTPAKIQLADLQMSHNIQVLDNRLWRVFHMILKGRATGEGAETDVKNLEGHLQQAPVFAGATTNVSIPIYRADMTPEAQKEDRIFEILCKYTPRSF